MVTRLGFGALTVAALFAAPVTAQEYPTKPPRFIAPNLPRGPTDILARLVGR